MPSSSSPPPTYILVCLHESCSQEAAQFIADRLRNEARLSVHQEHVRPNGLILHVSAEKRRILELAETLKIKKPDKDGIMRAFAADKLNLFADEDEVLTLSDIHRCVIYAMESLHFQKDQKHLPGNSRT